MRTLKNKNMPHLNARRVARHPVAATHRPHFAQQRRRAEVRTAQVETPSTLIFEPDLSIQNVEYQEGMFSIKGRLTSSYPPGLVYDVLTAYHSLPEVFHNIAECSVRLTDNGEKHLTQKCSWRFLVFSGSFTTELLVAENEDARQLEFSLLKSGPFMSKFVGSWDVKEAASGGSEIFHTLAVQPTLSPPQKIGDLTKKIFGRQVEGILRDLAAELHRRSLDS